SELVPSSRTPFFKYRYNVPRIKNPPNNDNIQNERVTFLLASKNSLNVYLNSSLFIAASAIPQSQRKIRAGPRVRRRRSAIRAIWRDGEALRRSVASVPACNIRRVRRRCITH